MKFEHKRFFDEYEKIYGALTPNQADGLRNLLWFIEADAEIQSPVLSHPEVLRAEVLEASKELGWAAYMLATVKHECADTWQPIVERGSADYFNKYNAGTPIGQRLGNTQTGDGYRFRGRGYVQITGRANYSKMNQALGLRAALLNDPDEALDPEIAYRIMSYGMRQGSFTGKRLGHYISEAQKDYKNARRIINGLDQWAKIKTYAEELESVLRSSVIS